MWVARKDSTITEKIKKKYCRIRESTETECDTATLCMSNTNSLIRECHAQEMEVSEVKERPSSLPTRSSVHRNSTDRGGSEMLMLFRHILLEALLCFCLHQDHPPLLCIIKHTNRHRRFVPERGQ